MTTPAEQLNAEVGDRLGPYREVASDSTDALHRDTCDEVERLMATEPDVAARVIVDLCGQPGWWWRSPLGMWCAEALAGVDARVSYRDAADMLGVGVAQVHELMWAKALGAPAPNGFSPIRVLDARHRSTAGAVRDATPSELRGPVTTHLRRGHWRQQAVGPRDEGRREPRWIAPTIVNPGGQPDDRPVAYRLLPPEKRMAAPRWVARRAKAPAVNPANRGGGGFLSGGRG